MSGRHALFIPGPTHVPDRVLRSLSRPMEDHRGAAFPDFSKRLLSDLKRVFKTDAGEVFVFPSSGTGAWEATLVNTLRPGDRVLAASIGTFSGLWIDMCERLALKVDAVDGEWGRGVDPEERESFTFKGPVCIDCHISHEIHATDEPEFFDDGTGSVLSQHAIDALLGAGAGAAQ